MREGGENKTENGVKRKEQKQKIVSCHHKVCINANVCVVLGLETETPHTDKEVGYERVNTSHGLNVDNKTEWIPLTS